jgi:hypothetical protein
MTPRNAVTILLCLLMSSSTVRANSDIAGIMRLLDTVAHTTELDPDEDVQIIDVSSSVCPQISRDALMQTAAAPGSRLETADFSESTYYQELDQELTRWQARWSQPFGSRKTLSIYLRDGTDACEALLNYRRTSL